MTMLLRIAERALNRPLLVHPDKVPLILAVLQGRIPLAGVDEMRAEAERRIAELPPGAQTAMIGPVPEASRFVGQDLEADPETGQTRALPYRRTAAGVALIPVLGALVNRGARLEASSVGKQSYEGITFQLQTAAADPRARAILLDIESPGGEAVGAFEVADAVRAAAKAKPVTAVVNGMATSAAYAIASGAREIVTTPTGVSGSIGVVMLHADFSRHLDREGITPTLIFAGAHKVDGNPFEPLSDEVQADLQREVEQYYGLFTETVARGRAGLTPKRVRDTQARIFIGEEAVKAGLADRVGTFEEVLADLSRGQKAGRPSSSNRRTSMSEHNDGGPGAETPGVTQAAHQAAVETARREGAEAERARLSGILGAEGIKGNDRRMSAALDLAVKSPGMSAEDVTAFVTGNVAAEAEAQPDPQANYEASRAAAAGLAMPNGGKPVAPGAGWGNAVERVNSRVRGV